MSTEHLNRETQEAICESLETLRQADQYYGWLCSRVAPFIRGKVLEIGAGVGTFARWASKHAAVYHPTDVDQRLVDKLREEFPGAFLWNLFEDFPGKDMYDTIIILNVVEHLQDDLGALRALRERLLPGGHIIVMVPAMKFLYGSMDRSFGHFRRYSKNMMKELFSKAPFELIRQDYMNVVGMFGWYFYGRILKHENLPKELCSRFNLVLPLLKLERPLAAFAGLSLMSVGRK